MVDCSVEVTVCFVQAWEKKRREKDNPNKITGGSSEDLEVVDAGLSEEVG